MSYSIQTAPRSFEWENKDTLLFVKLNTSSSSSWAVLTFFVTWFINIYPEPCNDKWYFGKFVLFYYLFFWNYVCFKYWKIKNIEQKCSENTSYKVLHLISFELCFSKVLAGFHFVMQTSFLKTKLKANISILYHILYIFVCLNFVFCVSFNN